MLDFHLRCLREWQIRESESYLFTFQLVVAENYNTFKTWASLVATDTLAASASIITSYGAVTSSSSSSTDVTISSSGLHLKSTPVQVVAASQPSPPKLYSLTSPPATPESPPGPPRLDYGGVPVENFVEDVSVKVPSVLLETSSSPPPPTRASSRGYLSEVKNSFGPRQSTTIIDKKSRGAIPQPPPVPPSWRDL